MMTFFDNEKKPHSSVTVMPAYRFQMNNVNKQDEHQNCYKEQWDRGRDELILKQTYIVKKNPNFRINRNFREMVTSKIFTILEYLA